MNNNYKTSYLKWINLLITVLMTLGCSKVDVTGKWNGKLIDNKTGRPAEVELVFNQNGEKVSGNLLIKPLKAQLKLAGIIQKETLTFNTELLSGLQIEFTGTVKDNLINGDAKATMQGPTIGNDSMILHLEANKQ